MAPTKAKSSRNSNSRNSNTLECPFCSRKYSCPSFLENHLRIHTKEKPYICTICKRPFSLKGNLKRHLSTVHGIRNSHTTISKSSAKNESFLKKRVQPKIQTVDSHSSGILKRRKVGKNTKRGYKFRCDVCTRTFLRLSELQLHRRIHTKKNTHSGKMADKCEKLKTLSNFTKKASAKGNNSFQCDICPRKFSIRSKLESHLRYHKKVRPYTCPVCSRGFTTSGNLKLHSSLHTGKKPFKCEICGLKYAGKNRLNYHKKLIHTAQISENFVRKKKMNLNRISISKQQFRQKNGIGLGFKCNICPMRFRWRYQLDIHLRSHTVENPYVCTICKRGFTRPSGLKLHNVRIHAKEKNFKFTEFVQSDKKIRIPLRRRNASNINDCDRDRDSLEETLISQITELNEPCPQSYNLSPDVRAQQWSSFLKIFDVKVVQRK